MRSVNKKREKCVTPPCLDCVVRQRSKCRIWREHTASRPLVCDRHAASADHPLRVGMGCRARNSGSKSSSKTRPSISSGTGWPIRCRIVGAISISRAPSISIPFRKGLPWAIRIPSRRCVPPHSAVARRFVLNDFDRRLPCMLGKTWAGGKEAGVPPIEGQIGGFIAVRAMKDFVLAEDAFYDGFARSWIS